jgi:flotillin
VRELFAAGQAAPIAADGEAMSASLAEVSAAWRDSGGRAMDMFVLQHLDQIFGDVAEAAKRLKVAQVNLIDGGDGKTIPAYAAAYPATMSALLEQVQKTLGVDIAKVVTGDRS